MNTLIELIRILDCIRNLLPCVHRRQNKAIVSFVVMINEDRFNESDVRKVQVASRMIALIFWTMNTLTRLAVLVLV